MPRPVLSWFNNQYLAASYRTDPFRFANLAEQSLLAAFGYSTGRNAPRAMTRLQILESFLYTGLPRQWVGREQWHAPGSLARLYRMIDHIEWAARMMELDSGRRDCSDAISQRQDDARWLRAHAAHRWDLAA